MKRFYAAMVCAGLFVPAAPPLAAQVIAQEGITRRQADDILNELRQIRQLLEKQQASGAAADAPPQTKRAKLALQDAPMLGDKSAPITMVEFTDFQCPYCQRFHTETFAQIKKEYIDTGKVRFFSRDYPLDFHPNAMRAAQAGRCAAEQGQFWKMRDTMAANPGKLDLEGLVAFAVDLKLDAAAFRKCVESDKNKGGVQTDILEAVKAGVSATPTFVIGKSTANGVDGEIVEGAMPYEIFDQKLKDLAAAK